jgi:RecB family endonuclease NucS
MTEHEMEDLVWQHPEKFLNEPLRQFQRQPASGVGRADLIFLDRLDRLLVIELKRGTLARGAVPQLVDYAQVPLS